MMALIATIFVWYAAMAAFFMSINWFPMLVDDHLDSLQIFIVSLWTMACIFALYPIAVTTGKTVEEMEGHDGQ